MTDPDETDEGALRRLDVELFIVHPTISTVEIAAALGLDAQHAHDVGHDRKTPKGTPLPGQYRNTRWRHSIQYEIADQWFADKVTSFIERLTPHKTFLHHLRASGGSAEIIVQFFGDGYLGDKVPVEVLATFTDLQLDFSIEVFAVPQKW